MLHVDTCLLGVSKESGRAKRWKRHPMLQNAKPQRNIWLSGLQLCVQCGMQPDTRANSCSLGLSLNHGDTYGGTVGYIRKQKNSAHHVHVQTGNQCNG